MRRLCFALALLPLLSACTTTYVRPNTSVAEMKLDFYNCRLQGLAAYPQYDGIDLNNGMMRAFLIHDCMDAHGYASH